MIVYSITYPIKPELEKEWLSWIKETHIPRIMRSGSFFRYTIQQLIDPVEEGTIVYNLEFHAKNQEDLDRFLLEDAVIYHGAHDQRFEGRIEAFDTVMHRENKATSFRP